MIITAGVQRWNRALIGLLLHSNEIHFPLSSVTWHTRDPWKILTCGKQDLYLWVKWYILAQFRPFLPFFVGSSVVCQMGAHMLQTTEKVVHWTVSHVSDCNTLNFEHKYSPDCNALNMYIPHPGFSHSPISRKISIRVYCRVVKWALQTAEKAADRKVKRCYSSILQAATNSCKVAICTPLPAWDFPRKCFFDKWGNWKLRQAIFFIWSTLAICCSQAHRRCTLFADVINLNYRFDSSIVSGRYHPVSPLYFETIYPRLMPPPDHRFAK